ncbi:WYL domain-containing protein [Leucobacter ruminantium]|uniref:WYL domain-containing protein n=1 Tax=Leucobacter ruminantium TaxID=1289170 RepID=A0A939M3F7_9MICO|nr:WYL domain-containing protein [Leucobacter ruminantium]
MHRTLLGADRVTLLLALVPYLTENGPTPVSELAEVFDVQPALLRRLVRFLGTAGVPGETMSYQHEDLFDIDWDALELHDIVSLTRTVAVDDTPRFAPAETAALIAGLQALTAVLPEDDAALARQTAARLGAALNEESAAPALSVTADAADPSLPVLIAAIEEGRALAFDYRDAAGRTSRRTVDPVSLAQEAGSWYLRAHCRDREAERTFRVEQMRGIRPLELSCAPRAGERGAEAIAEPAPRPEAASAPGAFELVAVLPERLLARFEGFEPEAIGDDGRGRVRVRIEAWHPGTAIRLVQQAPGEVEIEAPPAAREAVREWAERALAAYDA